MNLQERIYKLQKDTDKELESLGDELALLLDEKDLILEQIEKNKSQEKYLKHKISVDIESLVKKQLNEIYKKVTSKDKYPESFDVFLQNALIHGYETLDNYYGDDVYNIKIISLYPKVSFIAYTSEEIQREDFLRSIDCIDIDDFEEVIINYVSSKYGYGINSIFN